MYLNTLDVKLTPRTGIKPYHVQMNENTLEILNLVFAFKIAASWQVSRFLTQKDNSRYIYTKLRRMWQAQLLESFKVFSGSMAGMPLYYMLSKKGLLALAQQGAQETARLKAYPKAKTLLSWGLFKHEAQIVELASMESMNSTQSLQITFQGETASGALDFLDDKPVESFTPDYTATYKMPGRQIRVYTEFERTKKSNEAILNKLQRYADFLPDKEKQLSIIRFIFQTAMLEQSFWLNVFTNGPGLLNLNILTTHIDLLTGCKSFLEPIYANEQEAQLTKDGKLGVSFLARIQLMPSI